MAAGNGTVQSIDRVLDIIEALSQAARGMTLSDLSAAVGLHISTVHRLLASLIARGYVQKDSENNKYRMTMRMFEVGSRVVTSFNIVDVARPFLERLADITREAIHLVVREDDEVVYLYKVDNTIAITKISSFVGLRAPMYCTGVGKSILAALPEEESFAILSRTKLTEFTPTTITTVEGMMEELQKIRSRGYSVDDEEHEHGIRCVAAPIIDFHGKPIAAISVSAAAARLDGAAMEKVAAEVVASAREITGLIGGNPF